MANNLPKLPTPVRPAAWALSRAQRAGRPGSHKATPAGRQLILGLCGPGDPIGAVAVYDSRPYPATATTLVETVCLRTGRNALFRLLETHPTLARGLLAGLSQRLGELVRRLSEVAGDRVEARLARLFLDLAERHGQPATAGGLRIALPLSRQDLADLCGTTIETAVRVLSR